jgi:hypothetical protein
MAEHCAYWKSRLDAGELIVLRTMLDPRGPYGAGLIGAVGEAAARAFADADPAIKSNRGFAYEVYPMRAVTRATTTA